MASPVLAMNRTYNSRPACAICSLFNLANLKPQVFNLQNIDIRWYPHSMTIKKVHEPDKKFNSYRLVSSNNSFNEVKLSSIQIFNSLKEKNIKSVHIITVNRNELYALSAWFSIMALIKKHEQKFFYMEVTMNYKPGIYGTRHADNRCPCHSIPYHCATNPIAHL